jgi:FAD:protein FMN transferase
MAAVTRCTIAVGLAACLGAGPLRAQRSSERSPAKPSPLQSTSIIPALGGPLVTTLIARHAGTEVAPYVDRARQDVYVLDSLVASTDSAADGVRINLAAGRRPVRVSPQVLELLGVARSAWRISERLLDPTSPPLVDQLVQRERLGVIAGQGEMDSLRALVNFADVRINAAQGTVFLPRAGMRLDLSLVARGRGLDLARDAFPSREFSGGVVQMGPSARAFGRGPNGKAWSVEIVPPRTGRSLIGVATIDSGAVFVVSDSAASRFPQRHPIRLVNAKTGKAPTAIGSVVVIAPTATEANAKAAALYMLSPDRALAVADSLDLAAIIVRPRKGAAPIGPEDVLVSRRAARLVQLMPQLRRRVSGAAASERAAQRPMPAAASASADRAAGGVGRS